MQNNRQVIHCLFESGAFRVSEPEQPFWYTSGKFGPYYVNTHFLFGSEEEANELLDLIEQTRNCPLALPRLVGKRCLRQYHSTVSYRALIDLMTDYFKEYECDYISGGERRDFFFSFPLAESLNKPHISICKDGRSFLSTCGLNETREVKPGELRGSKVLHVADLVTEASSYFRVWLPSLFSAGAGITDTFAVVDRDQGGRESLNERGIQLHSFVRIDQAFFLEAMELGKISRSQFEQVTEFTADPDRFMIRFLKEHPHFLEEQAAIDAKTAERVERFRRLSLNAEE